MKVLLDEDVPLPLRPLLTKLLVGHQVSHVYEINWGGKKDVHLFADARQHGYQAVVTNNIRQFNDPRECTAIKKSRIHHVSYTTIDGVEGLALATAAICAAIVPLMSELEKMAAQRLVRIAAVSTGHRRYELHDPAKVPPSSYWP